MTFQDVLLLILVIGLPIVWLLAEFRAGRSVRITLGVLAILFSVGCSVVVTTRVVGVISRFAYDEYNHWYGNVTSDLISTTVEQVEDGQLDRVMKVLRAMKAQYHPGHGNRADYQSLVTDATARMRGDVGIPKSSEWDGALFDNSTWLGHWEDDSGYWIVIDDGEQPFDIIRSGYPRIKMESVTISDDRSVLTFHNGTTWRHTLTLINKYEAKHEWFDLKQKNVWRTDHLHKLIRASRAQRKMTQQEHLRASAGSAKAPG
jgi:hypothetical protein